jgi:hypothetical protein
VKSDCTNGGLVEGDCEGRWTCVEHACVWACYPASILKPWDESVGTADCSDAWQAGLSSCDRTPDNYVVVHKSAHNLALCNAGALVDNIYVGLGESGDKQWEGDHRTPEGTFYIARKIASSEYHRALLVSYPTVADADRGLAAGRISHAEYDQIARAQAACTEPPQNTALGGLVELHGGSGGVDWTWGCVAMSTRNIDRVYAALALGDTVIILP